METNQNGHPSGTDGRVVFPSLVHSHVPYVRYQVDDRFVKDLFGERIYTVTWNVGEEGPPEDFTRLLGLDAKVLPNVYAIGLQELKSSAKAFVKDAMYDDDWSKGLMKCLSQRNYVRVKTVRMQGIHLVVYVRRCDLLYLKNIESEFTRAGFNGLWGNKGGVSIRMDISGINVCFVNCHLAAHLPNVPDRIADYDAIIDGQKFRDEDTDFIMDHDYVFWFGDLNFRLDDIPRGEVIKRVSQGDLNYLLQFDQLKKAMGDGAILIDFQEGPLTFPPTYKYDSGTDVYDTSKKQRKPGWCDRVLWMVHDDWFEGVRLGVQQLSYTSIQEYTLSDHKPVIAEFIVQVLKIPPELPVMFEPQDVWCVSKTTKCSYTVSKDLSVSAWDWIGLYHCDFKHPHDYETYVWAVTDGEDLNDGSVMYTVEFDSIYLKRLDSGMYLLAYFSKEKNCIMGYSDTIHLSLTEESSESSDTDASSSDFDDEYTSIQEAKKKK